MTLMRTTQVNPAEEPFAMLSGKKKHRNSPSRFWVGLKPGRTFALAARSTRNARLELPHVGAVVAAATGLFHGGPDHDADAQGQQRVGGDLGLFL